MYFSVFSQGSFVRGRLEFVFVAKQMQEEEVVLRLSLSRRRQERKFFEESELSSSEKTQSSSPTYLVKKKCDVEYDEQQRGSNTTMTIEFVYEDRKEESFGGSNSRRKVRK